MPDEGDAACRPPLLDDSARATAPVTTSVAATATEAMSQRSSLRARYRAWSGVGSPGGDADFGGRSNGLAGWVGEGGPAARARWTACSIAPSARRFGVPRGGSSTGPSILFFLRKWLFPYPRQLCPQDSSRNTGD
jgi:hypothetical protein